MPSGNIPKFDHEKFQAEHMAFFDRYTCVRRAHTERFHAADQEMLERAFSAQEAAKEAVTAWDAGGRAGPAPFIEKQDLGDAGPMLRDYARDVKSCLQGAKLYTVLPGYGFPPLDILDSRSLVPSANMDRAVRGVFAASGKDVLDYAMRAAVGDGYLQVAPGATRLSQDPIDHFDEHGNGHLTAGVYAYELDPGTFEPEVCLSRDGDGRIVPGPFNQEWTSPGPVVPEAVYDMDMIPRDYFANIDVYAGGKDLSALSSQAAGAGIRLSDAEAFLEDACKGILRDCPGTEFAILARDERNSRVVTYGDGGHGVVLNVRELEDGAAGGWVGAPDLAWAAKTAFHEKRHAWQREALFAGAEQPSGLYLDMAVSEACAMAYHGYNDESYGYRLSENDADREGLKDALAALKQAFPGTDWSAAMLEAYNSRDQAFDDFSGPQAGFPGAPVAPRSRAWQRGHRYDSIQGILDRYDELDKEYLTKTHDEPCREFCEEDDAIVERNAWDDKFFRLLDGDGTKRGPERDREILASVMQSRAIDVDRLFPALKPELDRIRDEYQVDGDNTRKMRQVLAAQGPDSGREEMQHGGI